MVMCIQNLVKLCPFILKILSKTPNFCINQGPKHCYELKKHTMLYNLNVDLVNDNVYTKFGSILSIYSQEIGQKTNSDINQGP